MFIFSIFAGDKVSFAHAKILLTFETCKFWSKNDLDKKPKRFQKTQHNNPKNRTLHLKPPINRNKKMKSLGQMILLGTGIVIVLFFCACSTKMPAPEINAARQVLWESASAARAELDKLDTADIDLYNRMLYRLTDEHIRLKTHQFDNPDTLNVVQAYFQEKGLFALAGEARYIQGTEWMHLKQYNISVYQLKEAQYLLQKDSRDSFLLGMTHYRIGSVLDMEGLYHPAFSEYSSALQKIKPYGNNLYISHLYRDLARTYRVNDIAESVNSQREMWLDSALFYCIPTKDSLLHWDIRYYQEQLLTNGDSLALFAIASRGLHDYHYTQAANRITAYYLNRDMPDSAAYYLNLYAADSSNTFWNNNRYHELHARYTFLIGNPTDAYHEMTELYNRLSQSVTNESSARTYQIVRQYDLQAEKEEKQVLQIHNQRLILIIIGIGAIFLIVASALTILALYHRKNKAEQELKTKEKTELLTLQLKERLYIVRHLNTLALHKKMPKSTYQLLEQINNEITSPIEEQEKIWLESFSVVTDNMLLRLKHNFPALTNADCRVIMYIYLGLSIHDVCMITNTSKDTIWRRRNRIKQHLGLSDKDDLDEWLKQQ